LCGLGSIGYLSLQVGGILGNGPGGFELYATFTGVGDLKPRAAVVIAGVKVGQVVSIELDEYLDARCLLDVKEGLDLDVNTSAAIITAGLLGEKYVELVPGGSDDKLASGDPIGRTEPALSIEKLVGKFIAGSDFEEK
jgi:phospholipid/cholesterol/gamma-HCH transport system substrate-binding protein